MYERDLNKNRPNESGQFKDNTRFTHVIIKMKRKKTHMKQRSDT